MEQKTKLTILIILLLIIIFGGVYWMLNKDNAPSVVAPTTLPADQELPEGADVSVNPELAVREIDGKIRSINQKAVYIELADGKGFAANIKPSTPVFTQGVEKQGTLADLKAGQNVTFKADSADNAIQFLIKK